MTLPKHVHVIGISGVATSALAIAFKNAGLKVTGSDKGFFPPVSTELEKQGVKFYAGWHSEEMIKDGLPDIAIIGTASGSQNPETLYAKEHNIPLYSFAEAIGKFFVREKSIVVTGTWGKTSSAALLSHILDQSGLDPTYMFGGISLSHKSSARLSESTWSVFEGDEYKSSPTDPTAKFFYYKPNHLLITAVSWDHADLYLTEKDYFDTFKKLVSEIPPSGLIVANKNNTGVRQVVESTPCNVVTYGNNNADYTYSNIIQTKDSLSFEIKYQNTSYPVTSPMIGSFQAENITGCFALAHTLKIPVENILKAVTSFQGMKRRLEKRLDGDITEKGITVFDDIAHSPEKASSVLKTLKELYREKLIVVFEPNIGGRKRDALQKYDNAFKDASMLIIPRLTKLKISNDEQVSEKPDTIDGDELSQVISRTHKQCLYIEDDSKLIETIISNVKKGDVVVFLGSHGFRRMIEDVITSLRQ